MADTGLAQRAIALYEQHEAANAKCLIPKKLPIYTERLRPLQFWDYFYDSEQELLRSNADERISYRSRKNRKIFKDDADLEEYLQNLGPNNESSHDEDRPPASEELFMSDNKIYDKVMNSTKYCPPLTRRQRQLLHDLTQNVYETGDTIDVIARKREKRIELIRGYCKELKRKRYARTYHRFKTIRAKKQSLKDETMDLCAEEHYDKGLTRINYYEPNEPSEMKTCVQRGRSRAVQRKYKQYLTDPDFRRAYRDQVYFNVNKDVPSDDNLHMQDHTVLVYENDADQVQANRSFYGPVAQTHSIRVKKIAGPNQTAPSRLELNDSSRSVRFAGRSGSTPRSRSMSPANRDLLRKYGLDEPTHDFDESYEEPLDESYRIFRDDENIANSTQNTSYEIDYDDSYYDENSYSYSNEDEYFDQYSDEEDEELTENGEYTEYDEDDDYENYTEDQEEGDQTATEDQGSYVNNEEYSDEATEYDEEQSGEQTEDYEEDEQHQTAREGSMSDDDDQFEDAKNCSDVYYNAETHQQMDATASFASLDDEFVPSSELDFISDDYDDAPETPGWTKPISHHKMELFRKLLQIEKENVGKSPNDMQRQRQAIIRDYHISIIKRRRQQAINRIQEVLRQGLSIQSEAARLQEMELHDKMLDRGFYYHPNEPPAYGRLLRKRRNAIALKYEYYANYDDYRRQYRNRVMTGRDRPIEPHMEL